MSIIESIQLLYESQIQCTSRTADPQEGLAHRSGHGVQYASAASGTLKANILIGCEA